ncbi:MAG: amylo-alpha-1,6-glucosidase [Nibricoccus sp.]
MQKSPPQNLLRKIEFGSIAPGDMRRSLRKQWLVANGLGGYSSGTIVGTVTWRYHGLLVSALPAPFGRTVMLNQLEENLRAPDQSLTQFGGSEPPGHEHAPINVYLKEFRLENSLPVWRYEIDDAVIEKRVLMPYLQNTVHVTYTLVSGPPSCELVLRPFIYFRPIESTTGVPPTEDYTMHAHGRHFEVDCHDYYPPLRLYVDVPEATFTYEGPQRREVFFTRDAERGNEARSTLWSPGSFSLPLRREVPATLVASTEAWHTALALPAQEARATEMERLNRLLRIAEPAAVNGPAAELVLAADQFVITPATRELDAAKARATGDALRSVIAGYHWFTDWGRDTMISLEGLTLTTGRFTEGGWILRTFARYVRNGLIPNMFPEGQHEGLYHTADASLWFFQAVHRYLVKTRDQEILTTLLPVFENIVEHHLRGTLFGIGVDHKDGLLRQGQEGYQLTWMDAKVGDWVVTPRRGKAVEINALWYNALRLLEGWLRNFGRNDSAAALSDQADRVRSSFNQRFWNAETGCLYDVIDGEQPHDPAIRPNQVLAISLAFPVLDETRWKDVLGVVEKELVTPVGLRSLSRTHPDYKPKYSGDLRSRDAAYHQGTVWAWLIGPFIDAWLKVHNNDKAGARRFLEGFVPHFNEGCVGSINEIFDAEDPYTERGCIAQAWSVAEVLRCFAATQAAPPTDGDLTASKRPLKN